MTRRFALFGWNVFFSVAALMWAGMQDPPAGPPPSKEEPKEKNGKKESESKAKRLTAAAVHVRVVGAGSVIVRQTVTATFGGRELSERTNDKGIALFTLGDVSPGSLHLLLTSPGFETFQKDFQISIPDTNIEIELRRRGGSDAEKSSTSSNLK